MIVAGVLAAFCIMGAVIAGVSSVMPDKTPTAVVVKVAPTRLITLTLPGMTDTITPSETALATQTETLIALTATISPRPTDTRWPTATEGQQVVNNPAQAATAADNSGASSGSSQASAPTSAPSGGGGCCKVCKTSKACGDACISAGKTCNKGKGCACQE